MRFRRKRNWFLKGLALFFAFLLWFFVVLQDKVERELPLRVYFSPLPPNTLLLNVKPTVFRLKVVGPRSIMRGLPEDPVTLRLDLSRYPPGRHVIRIPLEKVKLPSGLKALEVDPQEVEILLDSLTHKWVRVKADLRDHLPPGLKIGEIRIKPLSVRLKGARTVLRDLRWIYTSPISLSGKTESFKIEVPLTLPEGIVKVYPERVQVIVKIERETP